MKHRQNLLLAALAVVVVCGVGGLLLARQDTAERVSKRSAQAQQEVQSRQAGNHTPPALLTVPSGAANRFSTGSASGSDAITQETRPEKAVNPTDLRPPSTQPTGGSVPDTPVTPPLSAGSPPSQALQTPDAAVQARPITEPEARSALRAVGLDPDAEAIWIAAINDPNLSPDQRRNLIEDLNEEGFPDPKNITSSDLPLIVSRMELIEELVPTSMDEANSEAFLEAYKDLGNMYNRLTKR